MANYIFEQMSDVDAASFNASSDNLYFLTGAPSDVAVTVNPASGLSAASITLAKGSISHNFNANGLEGESPVFFGSNSTDTLQFGSDNDGANANDTFALTNTSGNARYYGLGGNDSITGSNASDYIAGGEGNDTIVGTSSGNQADFLLGGNGADSIIGGNGNDHIYGNSNTSVQGTDDGNDILAGGTGSDYIQGNAGADSLNGNEGSDRLYGGADNDTIMGGAGNGNDYLQGNKGDDSLMGGDGFDTLRGGADNDVLLGGNDDDRLLGDAGADTLTGGSGYDQLTGGDGADRFVFAAGDANANNVSVIPSGGTTPDSHDVTEFIADYLHGTDHIALGFAVSSVLHTGSGVTFTSVDEARGYAQQLINSDVAATPANVHDVAAITVGSDTYLFYNDTTGSTINSVIKIVGVGDSVFATGASGDFVV